MQILRKQKVSFPKKYGYLIALALTVVVVLRISVTKEGEFLVFLGDIVYYGANYFTWALLFDHINGLKVTRPISKHLNQLMVFILGFLLLVIFHLAVTNFLFYGFQMIISDLPFNEALDDFKPYIIGAMLSRALELSVILILLHIVDTYQKLQQKKVQVISLEKDLHQTQLLALQAQINPHFLFNAMHTLNSLIGHDDDKARSMLMKLTQLLRKMLSHQHTPCITFKEELDYFKNYLEIEQERFNDRLKVRIEVDPATHQQMVPTLILQPLLENAFKHGISLTEGPVRIVLEAKMQGDLFVIRLINSVPKEEVATKNPSTKLGLQNFKERLHTLFADNFEFTTARQGDEFVTTLQIEHPV